MGELAIKEMTHFEAKECVIKINGTLNHIQSLLLDLYERKGWKALGYDSWRRCVASEFGKKQRYIYYQLEAAKVEKNICTIVQKKNPSPNLNSVS